MLNFNETMKKESERIKMMEQIAGKGLMMPNNTSTSGSRRLMHSTQIEHCLPLLNPEPALLQTGFENQFGHHSSDFVVADDDYEVIAKIVKFSKLKNPNHMYYLIVKRKSTNEYDVIERIEYKYITESYGYMYKNNIIDKFNVGDTIPKDTVVRRTRAYDEFNNRADGKDLTTLYLACETNKEDGIIISKSASVDLSSALVDKIVISLNNNDIPLNIYGDDNNYMVLPDIGHEVQNYLAALRKETKNESFFTQDYNRLRQIMISDESYRVKGYVYDIDVYCNNPENLDSLYYMQIKYYYDEKMRFLKEIVDAVESLPEGSKMTYELQKLYYNSKKILDGGQYIKDKPFSNIIIEIHTVDFRPIEVGDKMSNRYGGKGVVSEIREDHLMPMLENGEYVQVIFNPATVNNRENSSQLTELSINFAAARTVEAMNTGIYSLQECVQLYLNYLDIISPLQAQSARKYLASINDVETMRLFIESIKDHGIRVSLMPLTDNITIDHIAKLYRELPYLKPYELIVPQEDSNGNIRYIKARRKVYCSKQYIYRLKQYGEEKFSATSLSSTNQRNENSKNQDKKTYKSLHSKTPVRFGDMETGNLIHLGVERVIVNLMINSVSPQGRRLLQQLLDGDPYNVDVKLDSECRNRSAEAFNAYFLEMGLRLRFIKVKKNLKRPFLIKPFSVPSVDLRKKKEPVEPFKELKVPEKFDEKHFDDVMDDKKLKHPFLVDPFRII